MLSRWRIEGFTKGVLGGSRIWFGLGVLAWTIKAFQWALQREEEILVLDTLEPGDRLLVTARRAEPTGRRARRRARRG